MKTMYVKDLGCPASDDHQVRGETFEEIAQACQAHAMTKMAAGDQDYIDMAEAMQAKSLEEQQQAFASYRAAFEAAPED